MVSCSGLERARRAVLADQQAKRREALIPWPKATDKLLLQYLNDPRDLPLLQLFCTLLLVPLPCAIALFFLPHSNFLGCAWFVATYVCFLQRYLLGLHYHEHRNIFNKGCKWFNQLPAYLIAPFFGLPPGIYHLHHCMMHHVENNRYPDDLSSTEPYQRDSWLHVAAYASRFITSIWVSLPYHAFRTGRAGVALECLLWEGAYVGSIYTLWQYNSTATLWTLVVPFFVSCLALSFGNWSQHIFIDPAQPRSDFKLTYNAVNSIDNQRTFNDGYHIVHHLNSKVHWADMPGKFLEQLEEHAAQEALVFEGMHFVDIGLAVMLKDYRTLVKALIPLSARVESMSDAEKETWLRRKLNPVVML